MRIAAKWWMWRRSRGWQRVTADRCQAARHPLSSSVEYFPVMFVVATAHTFKFSVAVEVVAGGEEFLM